MVEPSLVLALTYEIINWISQVNNLMTRNLSEDELGIYLDKGLLFYKAT